MSSTLRFFRIVEMVNNPYKLNYKVFPNSSKDGNSSTTEYLSVVHIETLQCMKDCIYKI